MPLRTSNKFVVLLNTNEESLSIDLLNRSLPIRLEAKGDLTERITRVKAMLGGDVKHEWLPANQNKIQAELWGMINRWLKEGKPLDKTVRHPMGPWAATIGGILMVNGFTDFLANYSTTRAVADPMREALGILAFNAGNEYQRVGDLATLAVTVGLHKILLPGVDPSNEPACQRAMGKTLSSYPDETFTATTASERIVYRLMRKKQGRFGEQHPHGCAAVTWVGFFRDARSLTWWTKTHSRHQESIMAIRPAAANETREERIEAIIKDLRPKIDAAVRKLVERAVDVPEAEEFGAIDFEFRDAGQAIANDVRQASVASRKKRGT